MLSFFIANKSENGPKFKKSLKQCPKCKNTWFLRIGSLYVAMDERMTGKAERIMQSASTRSIERLLVYSTYLLPLVAPFKTITPGRGVVGCGKGWGARMVSTGCKGYL